MDQTGEAFQRVSAADKIIAAGDSGSPVNSGVNFSQQIHRSLRILEGALAQCLGILLL
jgi:hypothetical protein